MGYYIHLEHLMASALHHALVLAWLVVVVTSVLVLASAWDSGADSGARSDRQRPAL